MTVTTAAGEIFSVATFAGHIDDLQGQINALTTNNPRCRATKTGTQSIPVNTGTAITLDHEDWDVGPCHSGSSTQLVAPIDGIYSGIGFISFATDTRGTRTILVRANGSTDVTVFKVEAEGSSPTKMTIPWEIYLPAASYVQLLGYFEEATGGLTSLNVIGASLSMHWEGSPT